MDGVLHRSDSAAARLRRRWPGRGKPADQPGAERADNRRPPAIRRAERPRTHGSPSQAQPDGAAPEPSGPDRHRC
ncbi:MAG: hypothetical protein ACK559_08265, partial [bacterium]